MSSYPEPAMMKEKKIDGFDEWEVREAASTLKRAFEIRKKPKLLKAAMKVLKEEVQASNKALDWASKMKQ